MKDICSIISKYQSEKIQILVDRASYRLSSFFDDSFTPLFIIAAGRSGSSYLASLLFSFDEIFMHNEIFSRSHDPIFFMKNGPTLTVEQKLRHIKKVLQSPSVHYCKLLKQESIEKKNARYRGSKLIDNALLSQRITLELIFDFFPTAKVILLYREDLVLQFLSLRSAQANQIWHSKKEETLSKVSINLKELLFYAKKKTDFNQRSFDVSQKFPDRTLFFSYEALCHDTESLFKDTICPFLDIPFKHPTSILKKQNTLGYDICMNWEEIAPKIPETLFSCRPPFRNQLSF